MILFYNISEAITLEEVKNKFGRRLEPSDISIIKDACVLVENEIIIWVGHKKNLPSSLSKKIIREFDCKNKVVTPALVDSHTHLVFAGNRSHEYIMRLNGASYQEIAHNGGGIKYSSNQTNQSSSNELFNLAKIRLDTMSHLGVSVCEIKTGYSLTLEGELELLRIINQCKNHFGNSLYIHRTLLSAHAIPAGKKSEDYLQEVVLPSIEQAAQLNLVDSVDVFHEKNYFTTDDVDKIFTKAQQFKLTTKLHADELHNNHGAALASRYGCLSADHLLHTDELGAKEMAKSDVIATLLPGTAFFLGKPLANAKMLIQEGCAIAIASDFNPGSSYINDVFQIARLSAPTLGLNPATLWSAITYNAARALGLKNYGAISTGFFAKLICWDATNSNDLLYDWTVRPKCFHLH